MKKFELYAALCLIMLVLSGFALLNYLYASDDKIIKAPDADIIDIKNEKQTSDEDFEKNPPSTEAAAGLKRESYVIKYENGQVMLIATSGEGEAIKTPLPDINIEYLTNVDKKRLREGISLDSREELYKLLEDYSS